MKAKPNNDSDEHPNWKQHERNCLNAFNGLVLSAGDGCGKNYGNYWLAMTFEQYDFVDAVWQYYIESDETNNFFPTSSAYGTELMGEYGVDPKDILGTSYIYLNDALSEV